MSKVLFILFQGSGTNLKTWNEYTESKFLSKLKELGEVYTYQDKIHNLWHYDKTNPDYKDFDSDLDFDLSYVKVDSHVKMIHDDVSKKFKNVMYVPIGWSAGCYLALYFAQIYKQECAFTVLLDPALWTSKNMERRLKMLKDDSAGLIYPISNVTYKKLLENWKKNHTNPEDAYKINNINSYIRSKFIQDNLEYTLSVPTLAFINMQKPEKDEWSVDFNNKNRMEEMKILKQKNKDTYFPLIFINKTHMIFNKKQPANKIISVIKEMIENKV